MKTLPLTVKIAKATHNVVKQGHIGRRVERLLSTATLTDVVSALNHRYALADAFALAVTPSAHEPNPHNTPIPTSPRPVITKVLVTPQALDNFSLITARTDLSRDYLLDLLLEWDISQAPTP